MVRFKSDSDKWLVLNALRLAAERYAGDAIAMAGDKPLVDQFKRQQSDALRLAEQIEEEG